MNATVKAIGSVNAGEQRYATGTTAHRMVINFGGADCEIRVRPILPIDELFGYEEQLELPGEPAATDSTAATVADLLDSRMISPPRSRRRRQRPVSSRALFYGQGR